MFKVEVTKVSNGYIIKGDSEPEQVMVFSDDNYENMLAWLVSRRIIQMKQGEIINLSLEQRFTKIIKYDTDNKNT